MRSPLDRLRHAVSFELLALLLIVPRGSWLFHMPMNDIGLVAVVSATSMPQAISTKPTRSQLLIGRGSAPLGPSAFGVLGLVINRIHNPGFQGGALYMRAGGAQTGGW